VDHGIQHLEILKIENAAHHIAVIGDESTFLVVQINGAAQFVMGGKDVVHIGHVDAKNAEHILHDVFHSNHNWAEHWHQHAHNGSNGKGNPLRIGDGIGLGHDFAKDQDKHGHGHGGHDSAAVTEGFEENRRGKGGSRNIDDIVAKK